MRYVKGKRIGRLNASNADKIPRWLFPCASLLCIIFLIVQSLLYGGAGGAYYNIISLGASYLYAVSPMPQIETEHYEEEYVSSDIILELADVDSGVSESFLIELIESNPLPAALELTGSVPKILIYHTHTTEAYNKTADSDYEDAGEWRTHDNTRNIVAVGDVLAQELTKYGISVLHDTTDHEPPKLSTSYSRSVITMQKYKELYPSITMFIDVHRDAYNSIESGSKDFIVIDGKETARLMFVVGTGEGATGAGFGKMPDFASNFALAKAITEKLAEYDTGLIRNIRVKTGRYNQHISNQCLLVEVGHNANTLEQAKNAAVLLARAIAETANTELSAPASGDWLQLTP